MAKQETKIDPATISGTPAFSAISVPIQDLFDYLEAGKSIDAFLVDFDDVKRAQVLKVLELSERLRQDSLLTREESIRVLAEFDNLQDDSVTD